MTPAPIDVRSFTLLTLQLPPRFQSLPRFQFRSSFFAFFSLLAWFSFLFAVSANGVNLIVVLGGEGKGTYVNGSRSHHSHGDCENWPRAALLVEEQWKREKKRREKGGREHCKKTRSPEAIAVLLLLETRGRNVFGFYLGLWAISVFPPLIFLDEFFYNIMVRNVELK